MLPRKFTLHDAYTYISTHVSTGNLQDGGWRSDLQESRPILQKLGLIQLVTWDVGH